MAAETAPSVDFRRAIATYHHHGFQKKKKEHRGFEKEDVNELEDALDELVEGGISAVQAAMKSDHARDLMKSYESRVRSSVRRHISSMMP